MDRDLRVLSVTALAGAILTSALATAQAPPKAETPLAPKSEKLDTNKCAHDLDTIGDSGAFDNKKPDRHNLSDQLARSGGVICPPSQVDPAIKAPTPPGGSMPVIPPPGSPGRDPKVQPK